MCCRARANDYHKNVSKCLAVNSLIATRSLVAVHSRGREKLTDDLAMHPSLRAPDEETRAAILFHWLLLYTRCSRNRKSRGTRAQSSFQRRGKQLVRFFCVVFERQLSLSGSCTDAMARFCSWRTILGWGIERFCVVGRTFSSGRWFLICRIDLCPARYAMIPNRSSLAVAICCVSNNLKCRDSAEALKWGSSNC